MKTPNLPIFLCLLHSLTLSAADIPSWRNGGNGLYPEATPPLDWSEESRVEWETSLPGRSNACPILVGGKLFLTAEPATVLCADAKSGEILWRSSNEHSDLFEQTPGQRQELDAARAKLAAVKEKTEPLERDLYRLERRMRRDRGNAEMKRQADELREEIAELKRGLGPLAEGMEKPPTHETNGYSSYTPVSDGEKVWTCFGTGVVVCHDLAGKRLWHRRIGTPDHGWGGASSPTLVDGNLIVRFSDYVALDPASGKELWRAASEGVVFNAPASFEVEGAAYLVTARGEVIRVADGKKVWSAGYKVDAKPWCFMNTPSVIGRRIYFAHGCEGQQGDAYCLEIPAATGALENEGLKEIWHARIDQNRYYSSPLVHDGVVYLISREYRMQALDAGSGGEIWSEKVKGFTGTAYPSLTLAGDAIFVGAEDGNAAFLKPGRKYEELARTKVDPYRSTPVFDGGVCYVRTQEKLRAIRAK